MNTSITSALQQTRLDTSTESRDDDTYDRSGALLDPALHSFQDTWNGSRPHFLPSDVQPPTSLEQAKCIMSLARVTRDTHAMAFRLSKKRAQECKLRAQIYELQAQQTEARLEEADLDVGRASWTLRRRGYKVHSSPQLAMQQYGSASRVITAANAPTVKKHYLYIWINVVLASSTYLSHHKPSHHMTAPTKRKNSAATSGGSAAAKKAKSGTTGGVTTKSKKVDVAKAPSERSSKSKSKSTTVAKDGSELRRSERPGKGEGGVVARLTDLSGKIEHKPKAPKSRVQGIPDAAPVNPMAPPTKKPKNPPRKHPVDAKPAAPEATTPQFLVPPGTEPQLPAPQLTVSSRGHQFGFQYPEVLKAQVSSAKEPPSKANLNIDPALTTADKHGTVDEDVIAAEDEDEGEPEESGAESESNGDEQGSDGADESGDVEDDGAAEEDIPEDLEQEIAFLMARYGSHDDSICYHDSRVSDLINAGAKTDGSSEELIQQLRIIHRDWCHDNSADQKKATLMGSFDNTEYQPSGSNDDITNNEEYDVLEEYYKKNKPKKAPRSTSCKRDEVSQNAASDEDHDSSDTSHARTQHSQRRSNRDLANPTKLQFYPERVQYVLGLAKSNWHLWITLDWGFPNFRDRKIVAKLTECLTDAIAQYEADGGTLEPGYYPKYKDKMVRLLWNDTSTFRSELKKVARQQVPNLYGIFPKPAENEPRISRAAYQAHVKATVADLLDGGKFMHNGKDQNGRTNNLTHPAVGELCRIFFYGASNKLGHEFPDEFESEVPDMAIALVITAIKCALDEWASGSLIKIKFEAEKYLEPYEKTVKLIQQVKGNEYHGTKFRNSQREWALSSMQVDVNTSTSNCGFQIDLS
ncbi:hypothetical protein HWV62_9215 [Athelia sp. TMB]|nr:hypothetical protein HWV62_9215 [Athelia sp. TMB]